MPCSSENLGWMGESSHFYQGQGHQSMCKCERSHSLHISSYFITWTRATFANVCLCLWLATNGHNMLHATAFRTIPDFVWPERWAISLWRITGSLRHQRQHTDWTVSDCPASNCVCVLKCFKEFINRIETTVECAFVVPCSSLSCAIIVIFSLCSPLCLPSSHLCRTCTDRWWRQKSTLGRRQKPEYWIIECLHQYASTCYS